MKLKSKIINYLGKKGLLTSQIVYIAITIAIIVIITAIAINADSIYKFLVGGIFD